MGAITGKCAECGTTFLYWNRKRDRRRFCDLICYREYIQSQWLRHLQRVGECWVSDGKRWRGGYVRLLRDFGDRWIFIGVHKLSFLWFRGPVPEGLQVCHTCDNPPCCNPYHLFLGTDEENKKDCYRKNRLAFGERHGMSVLTEEKVQRIRQRFISGGRNTKGRLAKEFGVSRRTIQMVVERKSWKRTQ